MNQTKSLQIALKEWSVTVDALASGDQMFLLRKGGIREENRHWNLEHRRFLLYPTRYHETGDLLKPYYQHLLGVEDGISEHSVTIKVAAETEMVFSIDASAQLDALSDLHIWTPEFIAKRIAWKPRYAAKLILLRSYILPQPLPINIEPHHRGCRSWIDLNTPIDITDATPAVSHKIWGRRCAQVQEALEATEINSVLPV